MADHLQPIVNIQLSQNRPTSARFHVPVVHWYCAEPIAFSHSHVTASLAYDQNTTCHKISEKFSRVLYFRQLLIILQERASNQCAYNTLLLYYAAVHVASLTGLWSPSGCLTKFTSSQPPAFFAFALVGYFSVMRNVYYSQLLHPSQRAQYDVSGLCPYFHDSRRCDSADTDW